MIISEQKGRIDGFQYDEDGFQFQVKAYPLPSQVNRLRYMHTPELEHDSFVLARRKALIATFEAMVKIEINIKDYINLEK